MGYTDPSGYCSSGVCCSPDNCNPDLEPATQWLIGAMRENAVSPEAQEILKLNRLALGLIATPLVIPSVGAPPLPLIIGVPCAAGAIPPKALAYLKWIDMVRTDAPWDFKGPILLAQRREFWWGAKNLLLCCGDYGYEAIANIHYGYVGRAAGFTNFELKAGAGAAQYQEHRNAEWYRERMAAGEVGWHTYYDEQEDQAGIQIGLDLYNNRAPIATDGFCDIFRRWAPQLKPAEGYVKPWYDTGPKV